MLEIRKGIEEIKGDVRESYGKVTIYNGFPYNFYDIKKTVFDANEQALSKALLEAILGKESADEMQRYYPKVSRAFTAEFNEKIMREIVMSGALERFPSQQFSQALRKDFIALLKQGFPEIKKTEDVVDYVLDNSIGYGFIAPLLCDPELEEIMVNSPRFPVFVFHRKSGMCKTNLEVVNEETVEKLVQKIALTIDKKFDADNPLLDARLPDGSRVNATFKLVSPKGFSLTIRKFTEVPYSVVDLIENGTLTAELAAFLWVMVEGFNIEPMNIIVTGGSSSGKTTTLNALATFIRHSDRIVSIEDTLELDLGSRENWIPLESKPAIASKAVISMDDLLKNAMRMRPDRIILGEVRGEEAQTLFTAMDTGHQGALAGDAQIQLSSGNILPISALAEEYFSKCKINVGDGFEFVEPPVKIQTISFNKKNFCLEPKPITRIWRKKTNEKLLKINLKSGKSITLTKDHPLYRIDNSIQQVNAQTLNAGDFIAVPAKICAGIEKATVAEQPINWQQVKSIEETEYGDFVYDLTVEDNHTYIANGFIVSNCMGTLHSNSAREMLLRLQAKPMNVPESMLTLLNLVLVQYKMYSKVKGPIRRVAQVAELTRMDEKVLLSNVFEWERKKDKIERTDVPSNIIEFLAEKAGMTKNELKREMLVRQRILEWMLLHNIKKNEEVEQMIQQYYLDPDSILEEVLKEI